MTSNEVHTLCASPTSLKKESFHQHFDGKRFNLLNAGFSPWADICFSGSHALKALMRDSCCNPGVMRTRSGLRMSAATGSLLVEAAYATGAAAETGGERPGV